MRYPIDTTIRETVPSITILAFIMVMMTALLLLCSCTPGDVTQGSGSDAARSSSEDRSSDLGAIAAKTEGVEVYESQVEDFIARYRAYADATSDEAFATLLDQSGYTPESFRQKVIEQLVSDEIVRQRAAEAGIELAADEVDNYIADVRDGLGYADNPTAWKSTLDITGYDEASYRHDIETKMLTERLVESQVGSAEASESEMVVHANDNVSSYIGADIVSVVFPAGNGSAASMFVKENSGDTESEFLEAAAQTVGSGRAQEVAYDGWTCLADLSSSVIQALSSAMPGDVVMAQDDDGSYRVSFVKAVYMPNALGQIEYQSMPEEIKAKLRSDASAENRSNLIAGYMDGIIRSLAIDVAQMPDDASYNIDMALSTYGADSGTMTDEEIEQASQAQVESMSE